MEKEMKGFLSLGKWSVNRIIHYLFYAGMIPIAFQAYTFGKFLYLNNTYLKGASYIQDGQQVYTDYPVPHAPLGFFGAIAFFIVGLLIWKLTCELLLIMFRFFESNTKKE